MARMDFRTTVAKLVDTGSYRHALFYHRPGGLRFELSRGGSPLEMVLTALGKATAICKDIFGEDDAILVHLQRYAPANRFQLRSMLRELKLAGISPPRARQVWVEELGRDHDDPDCEDEAWIHFAFELPASKLQSLLWCALTCDLAPLRPRPGCRIYLIHPGKDVIVHPYDDRGMDVIGRGASTLKALYVKHHGWLLDYDLDTMKQTFETGISGTARMHSNKQAIDNVPVLKDAECERPIP
jgi:hypothetical protein